jgi:predicted transcriptional regulator
MVELHVGSAATTRPVLPLCYHARVPTRQKRSISLPPELATRVERAAAASGKTVSGWLAETAARRLKIEAGLAALAEWEAEAGPLTEEERAEGEAWARRVLADRRARPASR